MTIKDQIKFYKFDGTIRETKTIDGTIYEELNKFKAQVVSAMDDEIVRVAVEAARQEGITDLVLMDKQFVLDALANAVKTRREHEDPKGRI